MRVRALEAADVARELDHRQLHAEADAEERDAVLARVADRGDLALDAAVAEAAGHEDRVEAAEQRRRAAALDLLRVDVLELRRATSFARPPWTSASCSDL